MSKKNSQNNFVKKLYSNKYVTNYTSAFIVRNIIYSKCKNNKIVAKNSFFTNIVTTVEFF